MPTSLYWMQQQEDLDLGRYLALLESYKKGEGYSRGFRSGTVNDSLGDAVEFSGQ